MITKHLSEEQIQQYALSGADPEKKFTDHLLFCEECNANIASYQLLFAGIVEQSQPTFEFDLSAVVLSRIEKSKPRLLPDSYFTYLLVFVFLLVTGISAYIFRSYWLSLLAGIGPLLIYLVATTLLVITVILVFDIFKDYQNKINSLDLY